MFKIIWNNWYSIRTKGVFRIFIVWNFDWIFKYNTQNKLRMKYVIIKIYVYITVVEFKLSLWHIKLIVKQIEFVKNVSFIYIYSYLCWRTTTSILYDFTYLNKFHVDFVSFTNKKNFYTCSRCSLKPTYPRMLNL